MQSLFFRSIFATAMLMGLAACEKTVSEEAGGGNPGSLLEVRTRAGDGAVVSYPVQVYVFAGEECRAVQTIASASEQLSIPLYEGTYSVYAVGGADASCYDLPSQDDATPTSPLVLKAGADQADLMSAHGTITLTDGETNQLNLTMNRAVMQLSNVTIRQVPRAATAVSVTLSPLWSALSVNGSYYLAGQSTKIDLVRDAVDERLWQNEVQDFLMPASDDAATITVSITTAEGTKSYTYNCPEKLEANYKLDITGTYTEAVGVTLSGTITGAQWAGTKTITFDFDESGVTSGNVEETPSDNPSSGEPSAGGTPSGGTPSAGGFVVDAIPAAGSLYKGCYVLTSTVAADGKSAELLLLSSTEKVLDSWSSSTTTEQRRAAVDEAMPICSVEGIDGWRLMTASEVDRLGSIAGSINSSGATQIEYSTYIYEDNGSILLYLMGNRVPNYSAYNKDHILRPVAQVTVTKQ